MPTDPHQPSPLDEIQAVLDSYCHVTDLNSAPKPQLHCHNPPTDFSQLNLSFFSPKNNHASPLHAPQTTKENKHSAIQHTASKVTTRSKLKRRKQPLQTKANPNPVPSSPQRSRKKPAQKIAKPRKFRRGNNKPEDPVSPLSPLTRPSRHGNEHTDNAVCAKNKDAKVTTSNDEGENSEFIEQMRRLTARKLEVRKLFCSDGAGRGDVFSRHGTTNASCDLTQCTVTFRLRNAREKLLEKRQCSE